MAAERRVVREVVDYDENLEQLLVPVRLLVLDDFLLGGYDLFEGRGVVLVEEEVVAGSVGSLLFDQIFSLGPSCCLRGWTG